MVSSFHDLARSATILGQAGYGTRRHATKLFREGKSFTVSVYMFGKEARYTQPVNPEGKPSKNVVYRIRVHPKRKM